MKEVRTDAMFTVLDYIKTTGKPSVTRLCTARDYALPESIQCVETLRIHEEIREDMIYDEGGVLSMHIIVSWARTALAPMLEAALDGSLPVLSTFVDE